MRRDPKNLQINFSGQRLQSDQLVQTALFTHGVSKYDA